MTGSKLLMIIQILGEASGTLTFRLSLWLWKSRNGSDKASQVPTCTSPWFLSEQLVELYVQDSNATVYLVLIFHVSVFSNQLSKELILNFRPPHFVSELPYERDNN